MGEAGSLPLPAGKPASLPATGNGGSHAATLTAQAGVLATSAIDAPLLAFDLLLGASPDTTGALPPALPGKPDPTPANDLTEANADTDPLQLVLAQMPLPQAVAQQLPATTTAPAGIRAAASAAIVPVPSGAPQPAAALIAAPPSPHAAQPPALLAAALPDAQAAAAPLAANTAAPFAATAPELAAAAVFGKGIALQPAVAASSDAQLLADAGTSTPAIGSLQAVAGLHGPQAAHAPTSAAAAATVLQQPADPARGYGDAFSNHVALMAGQRISHAEIRVVPEHLGVIDIRLQLDGSDVRADFHSNQPEVRQALEASLPRLREMLGQQGLQLAHAGVGQGQGQAQGQTQRDGQPGFGQSAAHGALEPNGMPAENRGPLPPGFRQSRGLLDVYA